MRRQRQCDLGATLIPDAVAVAGDDLEAIAARRHVRVVGDPARVGVHPLAVESLQPVLEPHGLRGLEAERGVAKREIAASGRSRYRCVERETLAVDADL